MRVFYCVFHEIISFHEFQLILNLNAKVRNVYIILTALHRPRVCGYVSENVVRSHVQGIILFFVLKCTKS